MPKLFGFLVIILFINVNVVAEHSVSYYYEINDVKVNYNVFSWFGLAGDTLNLKFPGSSIDQFVAKYENGQLFEDSRLKWRYILPDKPGYYPLIILHNSPPEKVIINIFVMTSSNEQKGDYINGYRIGQYPQKLFRDNPKYKAPSGYIEVTEANKDVYVSPHFQLKQFLCKQQPGHWPKYMILHHYLLIKLERVIEELTANGLIADNLFIMSGYRTPYYNASIGNGKYSRHIYGDAVDVYVDENNDKIIDDLNKDGKASMADADVIYKVVEMIEKDPNYKYLLGGMGKYNKTASHTWDVHIDTRGYRARW